MKLAVIFDNFGPYHLARLQAAAGLCDLLAVEISARSAEYVWRNEATATTFRRLTILEENSNGANATQELLQRLDRTLSQFQPEAVAVPGWSSRAAFGALRWCADAGVPAITMSESTTWDEQRLGWKEWIKRRLVRLCSSALVGGSPHRDYMLQLGMPDDRVFLGYDAVDNEYFATKTEALRHQRTEVRKKYGLPEHYFLASARFIEKKNLPRLLQAYARYRALCQKSEGRSQGSEISSKSDVRPLSAGVWHLVILGDGPLKSDLCRLVSELSLQDCVLLPGFKQYPDLPAYYGLASAFIHASTTEQWGLVVNEAMASGLPVLVSNRSGCAVDLVQEGQNGFTFDPNDFEALAKLMLRLTQSPAAQLTEMGDASREIIADWATNRFAAGLRAAAECALKVGPKRAGLFERLLLTALIHR